MSVCDHFGNEYSSISELCRAWDISRNTYDSRKRKGWDIERIITTPVKSRPLKTPATDYKGMHMNLKRLCAKLMVSLVVLTDLG